MKRQKCHQMSNINTSKSGQHVMIDKIFLIGMLLLALLVQVNGRTKQKSVTGLNARQGCPVFFAKLQKKEPVTIVYCGNVFRSNYKLLPILREGTHTIIIRPDNTPFDKLVIYGSKPTQIKEGAYYQCYNTHIGNILLIGEVIK